MDRICFGGQELFLGQAPRLICADTNCWIAYFSGEVGDDLDRLAECMSNNAICMAPAILAEILSNPWLPAEDESDILTIPLMELTPGFWRRAGKLRASLFRLNYRPKLADTLIAQTCIDHRVPLLTRDRDFRPFVKHGDLLLW